MTLVEMAIAMLIFSVVMMVAFGFLSSVQSSTNVVQSRQVAVGEAEVVTGALSRLVHAAAVPTGYSAALVSASANDLVFYSSLGDPNGPTRLDIKAVAPANCGSCTYYNLVETVTPPAVSGGSISYGATSTTSLIATGVVLQTPSTASDCSSGSSYVTGIFEYFDSSGNCLPLSGSPPSLTSTQLPQVESLMINVTTTDPQRPQAALETSVSLQVSLPNVDYAG